MPPPDPAVWDTEPMRGALSRHDLGWVYWWLWRNGYSQVAIGGLTEQRQNEVSEILHHGRQIKNYHVLSRIAAGLGIPRGYLGLSWCTCPRSATPPQRANAPQPERDP